MTGINRLSNGSRLIAVFLYILLSHVASKGEATVLHGISDKIPQYLRSYSDDLDAIPSNILDASLQQPFEIRRDSFTIQGDSNSPPLIRKREEFVPEDVPVRTDGFLQSFLKLTPQTYSDLEDSQSDKREAAQNSLVVKRFLLNGSKGDIKNEAKDYMQSSEKKTFKLLLNKSPMGALQLRKRPPTRNWSLKRWWGGYYRPRPKMDRRATKSKHYECLKQCIGAGRLHPIQCHTLC